VLTIGDRFPEFELKAVIPDDLSSVEADSPDHYSTTASSKDNKRKWKVIFFWPKDFTFVCPTEISAFGALASEFAARAAVIYGASVDSEFVHFDWRTSHHGLATLPFPMLSDIKHDLSSELGVLNTGGVCDRAAFIVDPDNVIQFAMLTAGSVGRNVHEVLRVLDALQSKELAACEWKRGDDTIDAGPLMKATVCPGARAKRPCS